jgi:hypothetical protein
MDFRKAAALAEAWVDIVCEGRACIFRELTIAKPYGGYSSIKARSPWKPAIPQPVRWQRPAYRKQKW